LKAQRPGLAALAICSALSPMTAAADETSELPKLIYDYGPKLEVTGVRALGGIETPYTHPGDNCEQGIADVVLYPVVYDGCH
jgi:hypothetical protein